MGSIPVSNANGFHVLYSGQQYRQFADLVVNTTAQLEGKFNDWPSNIQDGIHKALEQHSAIRGRKYVIWDSLAGYDIDSGPYVRVIASAEVKLS